MSLKKLCQRLLDMMIRAQHYFSSRILQCQKETRSWARYSIFLLRASPLNEKFERSSFLRQWKTLSQEHRRESINRMLFSTGGFSKEDGRRAMVYGCRNRHSPLCSSASSFPKLWFEASLYKLLSQVVAFHYYCFFMHHHHHWLICALLDLALYLLACFCDLLVSPSGFKYMLLGWWLCIIRWWRM